MMLKSLEHFPPVPPRYATTTERTGRAIERVMGQGKWRGRLPR